MLYKRVILAGFVLLLVCSCTKNNKPEASPEPVKKDTIETSSRKTADLQEKVSKPEKSEAKPVIKEKTKEQVKKNIQPSKIKSISELWATYKKAKSVANEAIENGKIDVIVEQLEIAGESALDLGRDDIAAWQFNNIGHYSIEEFKKRTEYEDRIRAMATMSSGKEKTAYISATKKLFRQEKELLKQAENSLERAQIVDDELKKSRRTDIIEKNIDFINWVKEFIK